MNKTALVIGLGISGLSAGKFLSAQGYRVFGFDDRPKTTPPYLLLCTDSEEIPWKEISLVILSPGVPPIHPLCQRVQEEGIEMIGEIELALRSLKQKMIAITGTNGKTTVTLLATHLLNSAGIPARALGNVGEPLCTYALNPLLDEVLVIELSSYQIETIQTKAFDFGILLNITPDHLDRYPSMEAYARAKCHLQECIKEGGIFTVYEKVKEEYPHLLEEKVCQTFGRGGLFSTTCEEAFFQTTRQYVVPEEYRKRGEHDRENLLAAWILTEPLGVSQFQFEEGLRTFKTPSHRIEFVAEKGGVVFYDDSKGTNLDAVVKAVETMPGPVILIAGGVDKGASYAPWRQAFKGKVKRLFVIGQAARKMQEELGGDFEVIYQHSLEEAVASATQTAIRGDCVLLSPGCSSFDMFRDYAHRGEVFQSSINGKKI